MGGEGRQGVRKGGKIEKEKTTEKTSEKADHSKRRSIPKQEWIKFFHEKGTPDAKFLEKERTSHQLLVHGLPSEFLEGTQGGPQEKALNKLVSSLGIILEQEHIIGAHPIDPSSSSFCHSA